MKTWDSGIEFTYDIKVDPKSIPPTTLDEHVMIGGRYFDVIEGGYKVESIGPRKSLVTLNCKYRVTTSLNFYSKLWADFVLNDFNETVLEVIKKRSELQKRHTTKVLLQFGLVAKVQAFTKLAGAL